MGSIFKEGIIGQTSAGRLANLAQSLLPLGSVGTELVIVPRGNDSYSIVVMY
jgi:hypothetical protein